MIKSVEIQRPYPLGHGGHLSAVSIRTVCSVKEIWASRKSFEHSQHTDKLGKISSSLEFKASDKELSNKQDSCSIELSFVNSIYIGTENLSFH